VPGLWSSPSGLETHYGADATARYSILRSLATLAYDCRRSEFFNGQLLDALHIVDRGDLSPSQLRGGWAGEIGQTQFLPTPYVRYAVDFDGNGRRDLVHSVPDILASTANFLSKHGWQRGKPWQPGSANYGVIAEWEMRMPTSASRYTLANSRGRSRTVAHALSTQNAARKIIGIGSRVQHVAGADASSPFYGAAVARAVASDTSRSSVPAMHNTGHLIASTSTAVADAASNIQKNSSNKARPDSGTNLSKTTACSSRRTRLRE
jgi:hypothetical protein